ncbi:hypothetical protein H5410_061091 [Solanum commersonii]|uniref:Reverse transcriptase domain-containing protein n=1 Tax=Solanum commersonii TaxID=4109 RepID=A0A9J5W6T3_SOLCO|nr:hypothetical protein H5410_061091 [Solanum commersonii]
MHKWSERLNHLAYADDTIIFDTTDKRSLQLSMETNHMYEEQLGQLINKEKSFLYLCSKVTQTSIQVVQEVIGVEKGFGVSIGHEMMKKVHFSELIQKILNKLQMWKGKLLSFGGKVVLINHVLQNTYHMLFNGSEAHKYGRLCCRLETCLINRSCGKLKEVSLVFGLTIEPNLGPFTYKRLFLMNKIILNQCSSSSMRMGGILRD